jgi:diguanylate cyclase (GGDEF)-like protein/PAS domain S-box-containing protein
MLLPQGFHAEFLDYFDEGVYLLDLDRKITYWNRGAERITGYPRDEAIGHACYEGILDDVASDGTPLCHSGACPAVVSMQKGVAVEAEEVFLRHKQGHRVPVRIRTYPLRKEDGGIVGVIDIVSEKSAEGDLRARLRELETLAMLDPLTGVGNRRFGEIRVQACMNQLQRYSWPFGLIFLDLDRFKQTNDTFGHEAGDRILRIVARTLSSSTRSFDNVIRWGGEEFLVIAVNLQEKTLDRFAEKIRLLVEHAYGDFEGQKLSVTISIGATLARKDDTLDSLIARADHLMYQSKEAGRNRVTVG